MKPKKQQKRKSSSPVVKPRSSKRQGILTVHKRAQEDPIRNGVLYIDKARDGLEKLRLDASLQTKLKRQGKMVFEELPKGTELDMVNGRRRKSQLGKEPCFDVMDAQGASLYAYSMPLTLMAGLLQGLKSDESVKTFKKEARNLSSHQGTNYMFLHWQGKGEDGSDGKDFHMHQFVKKRPSLAVTVESLGNVISRKILFNRGIGERKYPGILSNRSVTTTMEQEQEFQDPHWDFVGWRWIKAEEMPWVVHVPICKEGMMLHIWPTQRDEETHTEPEEKMKLGTPKLVFVAFGDYLILRADVCHGGCFGTKGNMRFHMVLRRDGCPLTVTSLHLLGKSGIDQADYLQKRKDLTKLLGEAHSYFSTEQKRKAKTVTAYCTALKKNVYPEHDTWTDGLLENLDYE